MPEAFMRITTSPGPGVGSGNVRISILRLPRNTAPRMRGSFLPGDSRAAMIPGRARRGASLALLIISQTTIMPHAPRRPLAQLRLPAQRRRAAAAHRLRPAHSQARPDARAMVGADAPLSQQRREPDRAGRDPRDRKA